MRLCEFDLTRQGPLMFLAMVSTGSLIVTRIGQYYKKRALKLTKQIDADGDGFVTRAELKA